jgi:hypothetical protein
MTDFQPIPQTPEQVDEGLRNAFRQAIKDGVMDATPYLKKMTFKSDIEKTEAEIKVLQKKLDLLKEIETHKSQPRMNFLFDGKCEVVSYNKKSYYRFEFPDEVYWYRRTSHETYLDLKLERITDGETHRLLEGLWFNDVRKGRYTDEFEEDTTSSTLYEMFYNKGLVSICDTVCDIVADWLPDELEYEEDEMGYTQGWNDCLNEIKTKLR